MSPLYSIWNINASAYPSQLVHTESPAMWIRGLTIGVALLSGRSKSNSDIPLFYHAGSQGIEPQSGVPKTPVLPLYDDPKRETSEEVSVGEERGEGLDFESTPASLCDDPSKEDKKPDGDEDSEDRYNKMSP